MNGANRGANQEQAKLSLVFTTSQQQAGLSYMIKRAMSWTSAPGTSASSQPCCHCRNRVGSGAETLEEVLLKRSTLGCNQIRDTLYSCCLFFAALCGTTFL